MLPIDEESSPLSQAGDDQVTSAISNMDDQSLAASAAATTTVAAGSSAHAVSYDTATIADVAKVMDTLENVFGFPPHVAQEAVEAVGPDVTAAYNYILDGDLAQDQGGPVVPISDCPHVQHHVLLSPDKLASPHNATCSHVASKQGTGFAKSDVDDDGSCPSRENWICLQCGVVRCSRYVNGHGIAHYKDTLECDPGEDHAGHCVGVSLADLSVWCHACQAYLEDPVVQGLVRKLEELKFADEV
ncbi:Zn-finger in ubiquitin-hydrolase [Fragilaria crotonensis]|nr:Zn-finger in ubiquitin-hydrolase [Fragilaria crotonensis]